MALLGQQQPLDNQAIVKLHNAGLTDDTILHLINAEPGKYAAGVSDIIALKQAGISEKIIKALASKANPAPALPAKAASGPASIPAGTTPAATNVPVALPAPTPQQAAPALAAAQGGGSGSAPQESAVYYAREHKWVPLDVETVTWKVGAGKFKAFASAGIVKREVNGVLGGAGSKTPLKAPQFLLYALQNVAVTQYYFVHLRPHGDAREFLAVRQDDFEFRGTRDTVPFESKEVESHWYLITLPPMEPGEYGIVPPEVAAADHTAEDSGKMYTFHLIK